MNIAVFGTGAVGGFFGGRLALAGEAVTFIARGQQLQAIRQNGLTIKSNLGDFTITPAKATAVPAEVGPVDAVIVGVKTWQIPNAIPAIRPLVGPQTLIVPLQNGVETVGQLAEAFEDYHESPIPRVMGGFCRTICLVEQPGLIRHIGMEPYIAFNRMDGKEDERVCRLQDAFCKAGVTAVTPDDITAAMWAKFAFVVPFSGVGAVTRSPVGVFRSLPGPRAMLIGAIEEIVHVGRAHGVNLPADLCESTLALFDGLPPKSTASMQRDVMFGSPSELESQIGAVVRLGKACGVHTPIHNFIYASLLPQEQAARRNAVGEPV